MIESRGTARRAASFRYVIAACAVLLALGKQHALRLPAMGKAMYDGVSIKFPLFNAMFVVNGSLLFGGAEDVRAHPV